LQQRPREGSKQRLQAPMSPNFSQPFELAKAGGSKVA